MNQETRQAITRTLPALGLAICAVLTLLLGPSLFEGATRWISLPFAVLGLVALLLRHRPLALGGVTLLLALCAYVLVHLLWTPSSFPQVEAEGALGLGWRGAFLPLFINKNPFSLLFTGSLLLLTGCLAGATAATSRRSIVLRVAFVGGLASLVWTGLSPQPMITQTLVGQEPQGVSVPVVLHGRLDHVQWKRMLRPDSRPCLQVPELVTSDWSLAAIAWGMYAETDPDGVSAFLRKSLWSVQKAGSATLWGLRAAMVFAAPIFGLLVATGQLGTGRLRKGAHGVLLLLVAGPPLLNLALLLTTTASLLPDGQAIRLRAFAWNAAMVLVVHATVAASRLLAPKDP